MPQQPQQILVQVKCSERMPEKEGRYYIETDSDGTFIRRDSAYFNNNRFETYPYINVIAWYEPQTAIVLSEKEWDYVMRKAAGFDNIHAQDKVHGFKCGCGYETKDPTAWCIHADSCNYR
jgi:hypothetical protein